MKYFIRVAIHESIIDVQMEELDVFMSSQNKSKVYCSSILQLFIQYASKGSSHLSGMFIF